jgi:hypothetical protein
MFAKPVTDNWTPPTAARRKRPTIADVPFDFPSEPYAMPKPSSQARRLHAQTQVKECIEFVLNIASVKSGRAMSTLLFHILIG